MHTSLAEMKKGSRSLPCEYGAGKESRTLDLNLGKVALYQLSYSRICYDADFTIHAISQALHCIPVHTVSGAGTLKFLRADLIADHHAAAMNRFLNNNLEARSGVEPD